MELWSYVMYTLIIERQKKHFWVNCFWVRHIVPIIDQETEFYEYVKQRLYGKKYTISGADFGFKRLDECGISIVQE
jgi:hypothetical protein